jgi:pyruvate dehydrogenase E2 component (dihydrolipoamide acetyltransferase)
MSAAPTQRTSTQPHELAMPRLSDSMEEATIVEWLVQLGDEVSKGDEIAMIETDKATVPLEATASGTLTEIVVAAGETAKLGAVLARLGGESAAARAKASPVARRIAREHGIDLHTVAGNGPKGRIVKADIEALIAGLRVPDRELATAGSGVEATVTGDAKGAVTEQELTRLQLAVARRMAESKATVPDFVVRAEVDMAAAAALRESLKALVTPAPSFNDMVVKACALVLREMPIVNGSFADGRYVLHGRVNVGVAVAGEGTLVVPTVFDADTRSLGDIARTTRSLAEKVREGSVEPRELDGGTFTVSNLGMFGVTGFTAVINPPQAAILAVGAVRDVPVVHEGAIVAGKRMEIALTCDHRILFGADAARFVGRVRELLEQPLSLAL